jgi:glutamate N-acetyltransferase / amino-acid N-acetyltransferase
MKIVKGSVTSPIGFKANGISAGIKRSGKPDLALIVSDAPCVGAASFTKNSIKAAPLVVSQKHIRYPKTQAVIVNSGNANCFTGKFGFIYAVKTTEIIAKLLNVPKESVIVTSTGIIGKPLPFEKIKNHSPALVKGLSSTGGTKAAQAILTTDLAIKEIAVVLNIGGKKVTIGGCGKGSGMVAPNMATMLGFITTDCAISKKMLAEALKESVDISFNCISVDGCMSTNDMVTVMANARAGNKMISQKNKDYRAFVEGLKHVCIDLSKKIVLDGEGATKFIEIKIVGAPNPKLARKIGLAIANSPLVKTAAFGSNPNWGRVAAAVGSLEINNITEQNLKISFSPFDKKHITIMVDLNLGKDEATIYTCDLSYDYVKINGDYN